MHIRHCKKFREKVIPAKDEAPATGDVLQEQKERVHQARGYKLPSCCPRMILGRFEVRLEGETTSFDDPDCFLLWLQDRGDVPKDDLFLRGVLARGEEGSPEVTALFKKELRLAPTLVCWQRRSIWYLHNQCGHRFREEGAVCQTRQSGFVGSEERRGAVKDSPDFNVMEVLMLQLHHPVTSELRHRSEREGINIASSSQERRRDGTSDLPTLSLSRPLTNGSHLSRHVFRHYPCSSRK